MHEDLTRIKVVKTLKAPLLGIAQLNLLVVAVAQDSEPVDGLVFGGFFADELEAGAALLV